MKKILIVEDNDINLKLYNHVIKKIDAEQYVARDGKQALKLAREHVPDVIILDIQIPEINGMEVAKTLRKDSKFDNVKILAVTAYSMRGDKEKILNSGCDYYLSKPISTRELPKIVEDLLNGRPPSIKN